MAPKLFSIQTTLTNKQMLILAFYFITSQKRSCKNKTDYSPTVSDWVLIHSLSLCFRSIFMISRIYYCHKFVYNWRWTEKLASVKLYDKIILRKHWNIGPSTYIRRYYCLFLIKNTRNSSFWNKVMKQITSLFLTRYRMSEYLHLSVKKSLNCLLMSICFFQNTQAINRVYVRKTRIKRTKYSLQFYVALIKDIVYFSSWKGGWDVGGGWKQICGSSTSSCHVEPNSFATT